MIFPVLVKVQNAVYTLAGFWGLDLRLWQLNANKMFKAVLFEFSKIGPNSISQILAKCNGWFLQRWFCSVRSSCITEAMHWNHLLIDWAETELLWIFGVSTCSMSKVILKFSWWNFIRHWAAAVPLLETDTISQGRVCRYIFEIWPVLMACTWKNRVLLAVYWDKISIFDLGQPEHRSARGNDPLCAQHRALISLIWCRAI